MDGVTICRNYGLCDGFSSVASVASTAEILHCTHGVAYISRSTAAAQQQ